MGREAPLRPFATGWRRGCTQSAPSSPGQRTRFNSPVNRSTTSLTPLWDALRGRLAGNRLPTFPADDRVERDPGGGLQVLALDEADRDQTYLRAVVERYVERVRHLALVVEVGGGKYCPQSARPSCEHERPDGRQNRAVESGQPHRARILGQAPFTTREQHRPHLMQVVPQVVA